MNLARFDGLEHEWKMFQNMSGTFNQDGYLYCFTLVFW
jgi:hypothetical protein